MMIQDTVQVMRRDCVLAFEFKLPNCTLSDFIDTPDKWSQCVYETNTLQLWCDLMLKIESYNPLYLSEYEVDKVVQCRAEDIIYMHGMTKFFPTDYCRDCGIVHSVSYLPSFFWDIQCCRGFSCQCPLGLAN